MRRITALIGIAGALAFAPAAQAAIPSVFGGAVPCTVAADGVRECGGSATTVPTFDGVPIDVNVAFPPAPASGPDGPYPLVMVFHGWGGSKIGFGSSGGNDDLRRWTSQGYAAFSMSDRGWGDSCSKMSPTFFLPACMPGYIRLMDTRYEVRDAQEFAGRLADESRVDPQRIGTTGPSYAGGLSMALAALKTRKMLPDGSLVPWTSPGGTPMRIAAAAPEIPWTDLAYSLAPNGRTLDYVTDNTYGPPTGILKQSFVAGLFALGAASGNYSSSDPDANLPQWYARTNTGEPYDGDPLVADMIDELTTHHSSYYIDDSIQPAPLLIYNGWTDDLFPPDEALRFYNRTRATYPGADISLFFLDGGHQRGENKPADIARLHQAQDAWFAHFLRGDGAAPFEGVRALTTTCPSTAASAGPYSAPSWAELAPGEVRLESSGQKTIAPAAGDPSIGQAFDPISGGGACAQASGADQPGTATYRLPAAPAGGFTLMGSPTILAQIASQGPHSQIAARLLDVGPDGQETLVARGLYRASTGSGDHVFQLHPNGWKFAAGHVAKLELLPSDSPYSRPTNGQAPITLTDLELRLPVLERPGAGGGVVQSPAPKEVPRGSTLAPGFRGVGLARARLAKGPLRVRGGRLIARVRCPAAFEACHQGRLIARGAPKHGRAGRFMLGRAAFSARGGQTKTVRAKLTRAARRFFAAHRRLRTRVTVRTAESDRVSRQLRAAIAG
jgi:predicted acyl esterase